MDIQLLFPTSTPIIDVGVVLTFKNISGYLPLERTEGNLPVDRIEGEIPVDKLENINGIMTANEAHSIWDNA